MATTSTRGQPALPASRLETEVDELLRAKDAVAEPSPPTRDVIASNLLETWESYWLQACLPGADLDSLDVEIVARRLTVSGNYHVAEIETATSLRKEIPEGAFRKEFTIPGEVDGDKAEAHYDCGILTVRMPKVSHLKPAFVKVQSP